MSGTLRCFVIFGLIMSASVCMGLDFDREIARQEITTVRVIETLHRGKINNKRPHLKHRTARGNDFRITLISKKTTFKN